MFGLETRMLLKHYLEQGTTKSALARQLGVSRDTIHRWIRDGDLDRDVEELRYGPRPRVSTKLDAYTAIIETRLAAYPELSAVRLLDEIRSAGYTGGYSQLKALVRRLRPTPAPEPVVRFETPPAIKPKSTSRSFGFRGACGTRYSWSSAIRACCGVASIGAKTWRHSMTAWRTRFAALEASPTSCSSTR